MGDVGVLSFWNIHPYFVPCSLVLSGMVLLGVCLFGVLLSHQITEIISNYRAILGCPVDDQKKRFVERVLFKSRATRLGRTQRPLKKGIGIAGHLFFSPRSRKSFEMLRRRNWSTTNGSAHLPGAGPRSDVLAS